MPQVSVLVPLDGSAFSRLALDAARDLFVPERAQLTLLRVGQAPAHIGGPPPRRTLTADMMLPEPEEESHVWESQEWDSARARLRDEIAPDARRLERDGWTVRTATAFGDPAEEIVAYAKENAVDLVAMATHGRTGLSRALLGSVAERALRRLGVPVLMVRPPSVVAGEPDTVDEAASAGSGSPEPG